MIREITKDDIPSCAVLIRESFLTVAKTFSITQENAPRFTAFATTEERLLYHMEQEGRPMYAYWDTGKIVGYYSILPLKNGSCELNNLCVSPEYRHNGIGEKLLKHAFKSAVKLGCNVIHIGIVEENRILKDWYTSYGFVHTGIKKLDFFPFTCGYMEKHL